MSVNAKGLIDVINSNKSKRIDAAKIIEGNPSELPVVSKLVTDKRNPRSPDRDHYQIDLGLLHSIHSRIGNVRANNKNIIQLFPDIELAIQILVSSILSPKKMTDISLNYRFEKDFISHPELVTGVLDVVKNYIERNYKLEENLPDIVREALFTSGASVYTIIPESSVDQVINSDIIASYGMEEFKDKADRAIDMITAPMNLINVPKLKEVKRKRNKNLEDIALEMLDTSRLRITDNTNLLKYSEVRDVITHNVIRTGMRNGSISMESREKIQYLDIFRNRSTKARQVEFVKRRDETNRKSLGRPMVVRLPTESVIPVFIPGNESEHLGYFVLLDESGKPLASDPSQEDMVKIASMIHSADKDSLTPVQRAYKNLVSNTTNDIDIEGLFDMYKDILERQLYDTVTGSLYGKSVSVSERNDIYFLMFCRALQDQNTNILYVPKEQIVYYAFQFNEMGVGKSLLENLAVQSSLRAILLFSKVMGLAKQSIDVTKVNISLDPDDPDPEKTIEQIQSSVLKLRQNYLPLGINNPIDLVNWIQRAGLQFNYENNPRIPDVKLNFENSNLDHTLPDSDLDEDLRKQSIIALGLPPEIIDDAFSPEFAKSVVQNNILLSKRVAIYQRSLEVDMTKFVNLIVYNDEDLRKDLKEVLMEKFSTLSGHLEEEDKAFYTKDKERFWEHYLDKLSESIYVELPKPEDTDLRIMQEEFDLYKESLEKAIDSVINTDLFSEDVAGDVGNHIDTVRNLVLHYLLRKWMSENNFVPELLEFSVIDENSENLITSINSFVTGTGRNTVSLLSKIQSAVKAMNMDLDKAFEGEEVAGADESVSEGSDDSESDESVDGESESEDDFDMDDLEF